MTHFIGAVLVPSNVPVDLHSAPTRYPMLYGDEGREITPQPALSDYLDTALDKFDENRKVERWVSPAETIKSARESIEQYRDSVYARYLEDPEAYAETTSNQDHLEYLRTGFPAKLGWTDEEVYADATRYEEPEDIRESDGAVRTTWNENGRWDWWTIGGRWEETYRDRQGEKVTDLIVELEKALVNLRDPEAQAELDAAKARHQAALDTFSRQRVKTQKWVEDHPDEAQENYSDNVRLATGEEPVTYFDTEDIRAEFLNCRAYLPWWFPKNIVVPSPDGTTFDWIEQGSVGWWGTENKDETDEQWVETLIRVLGEFDPEARVVYLDFHV